MKLTTKEHRLLLNPYYPQKNNRFELFLANDRITVLLNYAGTVVVASKWTVGYSFQVAY
jgi:hypothetical protein